MSIKNDAKSVAKELSPILAGFKLALIVVGYFGIGSVAKWVLTHWYPFTRWVWDKFCEYFTIPLFPIPLKDSLTALIFFIPLGSSALLSFLRNDDDEYNITHRFFGSFFGITFLFIICKDALTSIGNSISNIETSKEIINKIKESIQTAYDIFNNIPSWTWFLIIATYISVAFFMYFYFTRSEKRRALFLVYSKKYTIYNLIFFLSILLLFSIYFIIISVMDPSGGMEISLILSISIIIIILSIIIASIAFVPKKLFLTAGACIAFVIAALCFEISIAVISFIERAPT